MESPLPTSFPPLVTLYYSLRRELLLRPDGVEVSTTLRIFKSSLIPFSQLFDQKADGLMEPISPGLISLENATGFGTVVQLVLLAQILTKWPDAFLVGELQ